MPDRPRIVRAHLSTSKTTQAGSETKPLRILRSKKPETVETEPTPPRSRHWHSRILRSHQTDRTALLASETPADERESEPTPAPPLTRLRRSRILRSHQTDRTAPVTSDAPADERESEPTPASPRSRLRRSRIPRSQQTDRTAPVAVDAPADERESEPTPAPPYSRLRRSRIPRSQQTAQSTPVVPDGSLEAGSAAKPHRGRIKRRHNSQPQQSAQCASVDHDGTLSEQELLRLERLICEAICTECGYDRGDFGVLSYRDPRRMEVRLFTSYFNRNLEMDSLQIQPTVYEQKQLKREKATLIHLRGSTDAEGLPIKQLEFERNDNASRTVGVGQRCIKININIPSLQEERTRERRAQYAISACDP